MVPICISLFDGNISKSFFVNDFKSPSEMITSSIHYLLKRKFHNYKIYFHNFSSFDSVFILKELSQISNKIEPTIRESRIIELKCSFGTKKKPINLYFRDSLLLLPLSLEKLAINFLSDSSGKKELFPYEFINRNDIGLDYIGEIPERKYFNNVNEQLYNEYKQSFILNNSNENVWNLKKETIKYCESDVITLHKIIRVFQKRIFHYFSLDILKYPTLPSVAFAIFRSNYLKKDQIVSLTGEIYNFISKGYTPFPLREGCRRRGAVDLYINQNDVASGEKVYRYDVNSLYPFVMASQKLPIGQPVQFEGDILNSELLNILDYSGENKKPYGFFEVEAPKDLNIPILQLRHKFKNIGHRTIATLGKWIGVYNSNEIYNAMEYGYKFKVLRGYTFNTDYIFSDYVNELYEMKKNSIQGSADYIISKLLLNSLYGRFGMSPILENHSLIKKKDLEIYFNNNDLIISDIVELDDNTYLISFFNDIKEEGGGGKKNLVI